MGEFIFLTRNQWELYKFLKTLSASQMIESCGFIDNVNVVVAHTDTQNYRIGDVFDAFSEYIIVPFEQDSVKFGSFVLKVHTQTFLSLAKESFMIHILLLMVVRTAVTRLC